MAIELTVNSAIACINNTTNQMAESTNGRKSSKMTLYYFFQDINWSLKSQNIRFFSTWIQRQIQPFAKSVVIGYLWNLEVQVVWDIMPKISIIFKLVLQRKKLHQGKLAIQLDIGHRKANDSDSQCFRFSDYIPNKWLTTCKCQIELTFYHIQASSGSRIKDHVTSI